MNRLLQSFAAIAVAVGLAAPAFAQDFSLSPAFGSISLSSGFTPDPYTARIQAGGSIDVSREHPGCTGFVARAPDYQVNYQAGSLPLIFSVSASADTTLVINSPNGSWHCDDDGGDQGLNPQLRFNTPQSGRYDVWVGTYAAGATQTSVLHVSELGSQ